jgi:uncharacterized integral membrane protein (TIGR00697 family)
MNGLLLVAEMATMFSALLLFKRLFSKAGLFVWIGLASVLANIQTVKSIDLFGVSSVAGTVLFASVFLATDLLRECYGKEEARKGVYIGVVTILVFLLSMQVALLYVPSELDIAQGALATLFSLSPRICLASLIMYAVANLLDVVIYDKLHERFNGKKMWLRNNISTIVCNCLENFGFALLAFVGVYPFEEVLMIAVSTCVIEVVVALCDTPFLYIGRNMMG